jgi:hypothetical protein
MGKEKIHFIYKTTNLINDRYYVGRHSTKKLEDGYLGSGYSLNLAINKYGRENFEREIIEYCEDLQKLIEKEQYWIDYYMNLGEEIYNISHNASGGFISVEAHEKAAVKNRGKKRNQDFCDAVSVRMKGKSPIVSENKIPCNFCGFLSKNLGSMELFHFKNCLKNPNKDEIKFYECDYCHHKTRSVSVLNNYHNECCLQNPNINIEKRNDVIAKTRPKNPAIWTQERKDALSEKKTGVLFTEEGKENMKKSWKDGTRPIQKCKYCDFETVNAKVLQYNHNENCINAPVLTEIAIQRLANIEKYRYKGDLPEDIRKISGNRNSYKVTCPYCNKEGGYTAMRIWHFDNCKLNPDHKINSNILTCPYCNMTGIKGTINKYHGDKCKQKPK